MTERGFETPEEAEDAFYRAFRTTDLELMGRVWTDGDRPLCIHPGSGLLQGKPAIMHSWMEIFSGSEPPVIEHECIEGFATKDLVVRLVEERIRPRDKPAAAASRLLATNVYLCEAGRWRLAEHHASLPLVERGGDTMDDRQLH